MQHNHFITFIIIDRIDCLTKEISEGADGENLVTLKKELSQLESALGNKFHVTY